MIKTTAPDAPSPRQRRPGSRRPAQDTQAGPRLRRPGKAGQRPSPRDELLLDLRTLEQTLGEVLDRVGERLRARLLAVAATVAGPTGGELGAKRIQAMREAIRALDVKPVKGRVKDLQRLRDLMDRLQERLSSEP